MNETNIPPTNRLAILSLTFAVLTVLSFCIGWAPFLLGSSLVCYPAAIFFGVIALASGIAALRRIRHSGESGRGMALIGVWLGGLTILTTLCLIALTISAVVAFISQLWTQAQQP